MYTYNDHIKTDILFSTFSSKEDYDQYFEKDFKNREKKALAKLAKIMKNKSDRFFLIFEMSIYEGSFKIAQAGCFPVYPFKNKNNKMDCLVNFLNTTQDKNDLYYNQLQKDARL